VFFAGDLLSWHHAVDQVGAGLATVLGNLQVIVVALVAWLVFGERPPRSVLFGLPIVLGGVVLISGVVGGEAYGANPALGAALGIATAFAYAGYLLIIRRGSNDLRRPAGPVAISTAATAVVAIVVGLAFGQLDPVPSWPSHGWLALVGITSQSIGYLIISISLPRLPAALTSIILLAQPVATVVLARVLLDEEPSVEQLLGVALVIGGIAVATVPVGRLRDRARAALA
jgi:drug/metabolite transporter (DMT)-like permease